MTRTKFEELRKRNSQKNLLKTLGSIDARFHQETVYDVSIDYQKIIDKSKNNLIYTELATGSKVNNIDHILSLFKTSVDKYIIQFGSSSFKIIVPFDNDYFEVSIELSVLSDNYIKLVDTFFKIDVNTSDEILIYNDDCQSGLCLFREEHQYYISIW